MLFPAAGHGAIAVETLAGPKAAARAGPRIAILHATAGSGHKRAAESLAAALSQLQPSAVVDLIGSQFQTMKLKGKLIADLVNHSDAPFGELVYTSPTGG